jgi:hypothetical protein
MENRIREVLKQYDVNGDETLDIHEVSTCLRHAAYLLSVKEALPKVASSTWIV